jgi:hypothetical protein
MCIGEVKRYMMGFGKLDSDWKDTDLRMAEDAVVEKIRGLENANDGSCTGDAAGESRINELTSGLELLHFMKHSMTCADAVGETVLHRRDLVISAHGETWQIEDGKLSPVVLAEG